MTDRAERADELAARAEKIGYLLIPPGDRWVLIDLCYPAAWAAPADLDEVEARIAADEQADKEYEPVPADEEDDEEDRPYGADEVPGSWPGSDG